MKKIIAAAVASAFIAPAFAAEVTVSGGMAFILTNVDNTPASLLNDDGNTFAITGSSELSNGMSIKGTFQIEDDSGTLASDGSNIVISGSFGKFGIGDNSGAADSVGDYSDVLATGMGHMDGDDSMFLYTLPLEGTEVNISHSVSAETAVDGGSIQDDVTGISVEQKFGPVSVGLAYEVDISAADEVTHTKISGRYSAGGISIGFDRSEEEVNTTTTSPFSATTGVTASGDDLEHMGVGLKYAMGDITIAVESQTVAQGDTDLSDTTGVSVNYNLGDADIFVASFEEDVASTSTTRVGVRYSF